MGFFSSLFSKPIIIEDDFFGRLVQEPCNFSDSRYCWYAESVLFTPTGTEIECMIDADMANPSRPQRAFYQKFESQYAEVLFQISFIVKSDSQLLGVDSKITSFESTHRLAGLTIPRLTDEPVKWELWFEPIDNSHWGYTITVDMIDNIPQPGIGISA